jgi:hypothetical protein
MSTFVKSPIVTSPLVLSEGGIGIGCLNGESTFSTRPVVEALVLGDARRVFASQRGILTVPTFPRERFGPRVNQRSSPRWLTAVDSTRGR